MNTEVKMDAFPHHIRPVLRGGDYYLARYFCEGLAVVVRGEVFCFQRKEDADKFRRRFGCFLTEETSVGARYRVAGSDSMSVSLACDDAFECADALADDKAAVISHATVQVVPTEEHEKSV